MAIGDIAFLREQIGLNTLGPLAVAQSWDTDVSSSNSYIVGSDYVGFKENGTYLILYSLGYQDAGGNNRSAIESDIQINGTNSLHGKSWGFIRRNGGADSDHVFGSAILRLNDGDQLSIVSKLTDNNNGLVERIPDSSGLQIVQLDPFWGYFRATRSASSSIDTIFSGIDWDTVEEEDQFAYSASGASITVKDIGHHLICTNVCIELPNNGNIAAEIRVMLNGSEVDATRSTSYVTASNNATKGVMSLITLVETTVEDEILSIEARCDKDNLNIPADGAAVTIIEVPEYLNFARITNNTMIQRADTNAEITFNENLEIDNSPFDHLIGSTDLLTNVDGLYMFIGSFYIDRSNSNDELANKWEWNVNDGIGGGGAKSIVSYGSFGSYSRGSAGSPNNAVTISSRSGALVHEMSDGGMVSIFNSDTTEINAQNANAQLVDPDALFQANRYGLKALRFDFVEPNYGQTGVDLLVRRFDNPNGGLKQGEVIGVYQSGTMPDVYNPAFYGLRIFRDLDDLTQLFAKADPDSNEAFIHRYILDESSYKSHMHNKANHVERLVIVRQFDADNIRVIDQKLNITLLLDDAIEGVIMSSSSSSGSKSSSSSS